MTISYKWLLDYLPIPLDPENVAGILNSIGLEVENMEKFEEVKGGLQGLFIGQVLQVAQVIHSGGAHGPGVHLRRIGGIDAQ